MTQWLYNLLRIVRIYNALFLYNIEATMVHVINKNNNARVSTSSESIQESTNSLSLIYLDANATTQVLPQAAAAALSTMQTQFGNPSSSHISGLQAKQIMDKTRQQAKAVVGAGKGNIIFTSGATEGIQTAILSALVHAKNTRLATSNLPSKNMASPKKYCLLYGATEHKAVPESLKHWNEILDINAEIKAIPVDSTGQLDLDFIAHEVPNALIICTMAVNNETGVYQNISQLDQVIRTNNPKVAWMVDCVQALGKTTLVLENTSIDYAPFSGHKLYAPKGIGFMYVKENAPFTAVIAGGGQESGLRSGTENLPGLAALSIIFSMLLAENDGLLLNKGVNEKKYQGAVRFADIDTLYLFRQQLATALQQAFPSIVFNHSFENSVATTLNFSIPGFSSKEIMDLFDAANVRVSSGSACSSKVTRSFVLDAMGLPTWQSESAIRMSFGPAMTQAEIEMACSRIISAAQVLVESCLTIDTTQVNNIKTVTKTELDGLVQCKEAGSCTWLYIDKKTQSAFIIDPLEQVAERLKTILQCQGLALVAVIDTHGHADHESCRTDIANMLLSNQKSDALGWPAGMKSIVMGTQDYQYLVIGDKWLLKVETPGHTKDSISLLLCEPITDSRATLQVHYAFCGDLILMNSLGRTNFVNSSAPAMYTSLQLLKSLIGNTSLLCPSHDYNNEFTTSFAIEIIRNSLLAQVINSEITCEQFLLKKADMDTHIIDDSGSEIMCGALVDNIATDIGSCAIEASSKETIHEYNRASLTAAAVNSNIKLIDIREPHEYALQHDDKFTHNVPLTRLVQFVQEHQHSKAQPLALICRSGSRSQLAAQALVRLGFINVGHVKGGYAQYQY